MDWITAAVILGSVCIMCFTVLLMFIGRLQAAQHTDPEVKQKMMEYIETARKGLEQEMNNRGFRQGPPNDPNKGYFDGDEWKKK